MRRGLAIDEKKIKTDYNRINDFCEFAGNKPVNKYSYFDFQKWSNLLVRVPQNHNKIPEIREMTRQEAAEYNERLPLKKRLPTLTEKTIDTNYLSPLRIFLKTSQRNTNSSRRYRMLRFGSLPLRPNQLSDSRSELQS